MMKSIQNRFRRRHHRWTSEAALKALNIGMAFLAKAVCRVWCMVCWELIWNGDGTCGVCGRCSIGRVAHYESSMPCLTNMLNIEVGATIHCHFMLVYGAETMDIVALLSWSCWDLMGLDRVRGCISADSCCAGDTEVQRTAFMGIMVAINVQDLNEQQFYSAISLKNAVLHVQLEL